MYFDIFCQIMNIHCIWTTCYEKDDKIGDKTVLEIVIRLLLNVSCVIDTKLNQVNLLPLSVVISTDTTNSMVRIKLKEKLFDEHEINFYTLSVVI